MRLLLGLCAIIAVAAGTLLAFRLSDPENSKGELDDTPAMVASSLEQPPSVIEALAPESIQEQPPIEEPIPEVEPPEEVAARIPDEKLRIERIDDRSIRIDDRFELRGNGTERDPYTISWEYLASANESIVPAEGKTDPAPHILALDGTWIRMSGYYSAPMATEEVDEVLLTLDRWDGCCIGLPPTPFDCVETSLRRPINMRSKHLIRFGTVTGRMTVQPFVIGNWLMGLYQLEDATLDMGSP